MEDLKPCPFCGHPRSRLMHRTEYRENAEGLTALEYEPRICVEGIEYGGKEYEIKMLDFRHVFYRRCNKCGATSRKVKTDWHVRTQDEADDFSIYNSQREKLWGFDPDSEWAKPWRDKADEEWNRRSDECTQIAILKSRIEELEILNERFRSALFESCQIVKIKRGGSDEA